MSVPNVYLSRHEDVKELAKRIGKDMGSLDLLTTDDKENIVAAINELKQVQIDIISRIEVLEDHHKKPLDQGPASEYSGTGWYKATDTGIVYNKGVPEGETHTFEGDPIEYISVWRNEGLDLENFEGTPDEALKLLEWHKNLHRFATSNVTDMGGWAYGYGNSELYGDLGISPDFDIDSIDISHYDTSNVTNMMAMFTDSVINHPLDHFDTSNVKIMDSMFSGAASFNQDISSWDTSKVSNMGYMFSGATSFNQDLSKWCVPLITTAPERFDNNTTSWTLPKPVWGTCPRGENKA